MSNLLQLRNSLYLYWLSFIFIIVVLFFVSQTSAIELGVSPAELIFTGSVGEELCGTARVFSSTDKVLIRVDDFWKEDGMHSRNVNDYFFESGNVNIEMQYVQEFYLSESEDFDICLRAFEPGRYAGVLFFETLRGNILIGIWMSARIDGENSENYQNFLDDSGFSDAEIERDYILLSAFLPITFLNITLLVVLLFAHLKKRRI